MQLELDYSQDLIGGGFKVRKIPVVMDPVSIFREILYIDYRCFFLFSSFSIPMRKSPVDAAVVLECNYINRVITGGWRSRSMLHRYESPVVYSYHSTCSITVTCLTDTA